MAGDGLDTGLFLSICDRIELFYAAGPFILVLDFLLDLEDGINSRQDGRLEQFTRISLS